MEAEFLLDMLLLYQARAPHIAMECRGFDSAEALMAALGAGEVFDLYFLDIIMPGMDGMSLARALRRQEERSAIIFLTSSADFAVEAFTIKAMDYLVKPVEKARLFAAMDDALRVLARQVEAMTVIAAAEYDLRVRRGDIIAVEVTGHTLTYQLAAGQTVSTKVLRVPFAEAVADLLLDPRFISPHRSYLVNMAHARKLDKDGFLMSNGARVPISRLRGSAARRAYAAFLSR
jgi:DNA-binding LytR/AlgR family response regulator